VRFRIVLSAAALALGWSVALSPQGGSAASPNIAYDEILKFAIASTPPPVGSFESDYAAIVAPPSPVAAEPKKRGLFGGINVGSLAHAVANGGDPGAAVGNAAASQIAGSAIDNAIAKSLDNALKPVAAQLSRFANGTLERHAFYNGWERVDDVTGNTATILKCAEHRRIVLDLARKTYRIDDPAAPEPASTSTSTSKSGGHTCRDTGDAKPSAPGTGVLSISSDTKALGSTRVGRVDARGYTSTNTIAIQKSTGSCKDGSFGVSQTAYYSAYEIPRAYCPLPKTLRHPQTPADMVTASKPGGCHLTPSLRVTGPAQPSDRLALYELLTMGASNSQGNGSMSFLVERGNVRTLGASDAAAFDVPAGFTREP